MESIDFSERAPAMTERGQAARLQLAGLVGFAHAVDLRDRAVALASGGGDVVVDCAGVTHLDTGAVQVLLALRIAVEEQGLRFAMEGLPAELAERLTGWGFGELVRAGQGGEMPRPLSPAPAQDPRRAR